MDPAFITNAFLDTLSFHIEEIELLISHSVSQPKGISTMSIFLIMMTSGLPAVSFVLEIVLHVDKIKP
jgi:hypothetical protein